MFYTRFLPPTDLKCAESSTYWQFFYYRPPGKFRWTSVNHFDKQREISLKCDAKTYMSLSIYIYVTLDNRYGFAISIGNTKIHVATLTCLEWHTMLNIGNATFGYMALILVKQYHGTYACFFLFHVSDDRALCKPGCASLVVIHWYSWRFWWWLVMFVFTDLKWPRVFRCSTPSCYHILIWSFGHICIIDWSFEGNCFEFFLSKGNIFVHAGKYH